MKRLLCVLLLAVLAVGLSSCLADSSIDELLTAPGLSRKQSAVMEALEAYIGDRFTFVYPTTGTSRAAIQFIDLDNDNTQEAVVFYKTNTESINTSIAVLEPEENGSYVLAASVEGLGDGIASCRFLKQPSPATRPLLLEWSIVNVSSNNMAVYTYTGSSLELGFEEKCTNLLVLDSADSEASRFCYLLPGTGDVYTMKYVELIASTSTVQSQIRLDSRTRGIRQLVSGDTPDGKTIFVDEVTDAGLQTEVFRISSSNLVPAVSAEEYRITTISTRPNEPALRSTTLSSVMCFPSSVAPSAEVLHPESWLYWYSVREGGLTLASCGYMDSNHSFYLAIPPEWLSFAAAAVSPDAPNSVLIFDPEKDTALVTVAVLSVDEDASGFISSGYRLVAGSGAFRYYALFNCSEEEEQYLYDNFLPL